MLTVKELIEILSRLPDSATVRAYEGEVTGIVIKGGGEQLEFIETPEQ